jgi:hypothetical protein
MTRSPRRPAAVAALALVLAALVAGFGLLAGAAPAGAHEGPGILVVESDTPTGTSHHFVIRLTWENDGHPAARTTTITLTPTGPDGTAGTPIPMTAVDDDGRFEATADLAQPGSWKVRFTALNPSANVEQAVEVAPPATTATTEAPATTTTEADEPDEEAPDTEATASTSDDDGGGSGALLAVAAVVVALLVLGGTALVVARSRRATPGTGAE